MLHVLSCLLWGILMLLMAQKESTGFVFSHQNFETVSMLKMTKDLLHLWLPSTKATIKLYI